MIKLHQPPAGEPVSEDFRIFINGEEVGAYTARVSAMPFNRVWPGRQRPLNQTELASFVSFAMDEPVRVKLVPRKAFEEVAIRPLSKNIAPEVDAAGTIAFTIAKPGQYTVELDGWHNALHIFANPPSDFGIDAEADNVMYFGAGIHDVGPIELKSGQVMFIDEGAVVLTSVVARGASNIRIVGHGILDNSRELRDESGAASGCLKLFACTNVEVNGIVFRDSSEWTATIFNCDNVVFDCVKTIGMWRYNADGIDFVNSANGIVKNSFLRNFDDLIVLKGLPGYDTRNVENILVSNCVLWCDWGRNFEIGAETSAPEFRNLLFHDCDLIHCAMANMDFQNGDRASVHDVRFDNIRVEYSKYTEAPVFQSSDEQVYIPSTPHMPHLFFANIVGTMWSHDNQLGENHDIRFRNIRVYLDDGLPMPPVEFTGANAEHRTYNITIEGLYVNGTRIDNIADLNLTTNEFAHDIRLV